MTTRGRALAAILGTVFVLGGCAHRTLPGPVVYRTVTVPPHSPSASTSPSTSPVAVTTSSSAPTVMRALPGTCDSALPVGELVNALGRPVNGKTAFVVGLPDAATGRLSYLNCRYGVSGPTSAIEIGVSLYETASKAAARISPTVDDFTAHGATASTATVAGKSATVLLGGQGTGYGSTVVLADGQRTIAVTISAGSNDRSDLLRLAQLADQRTSPNA